MPDLSHWQQVSIYHTRPINNLSTKRACVRARTLPHSSQEIVTSLEIVTSQEIVTGQEAYRAPIQVLAPRLHRLPSLAYPAHPPPPHAPLTCSSPSESTSVFAFFLSDPSSPSRPSTSEMSCCIRLVPASTSAPASRFPPTLSGRSSSGFLSSPLPPDCAHKATSS